LFLLLLYKGYADCSSPEHVAQRKHNRGGGWFEWCQRIACHFPGWAQEFEKIKFLLGHSSTQTAERYLGWEQEIAIAVNDNLGL
jgi:hypothetical protein